ncbi:MAG TPA: hypothetical protein VF753_02060 [Terriglobales bacterium]
MADTDHLRQTLEHYRQQRQKLQDDVKRVELMILQLEQDLGEAPSVEAGGDADSVVVDIGRGIRTAVSLRPDEFYGMSQSDAAKAYLRKIGYAIPFSELVDALRKGGAKLGGAAPAKTLYVSLARNPKKEFVWPSKDHIGLKEFYDRKN